MTSTLTLRLALLLSVCHLPLAAAIKAPDQLLPADTLAVLTVPDLAKALAAYQKSPMVQLWNDSSMKPFRDRFMEKLNTDLLTPFEQQTGLKLADYQGLLRGQCTLAIIQNGWTGAKDQLPSLLLLLDSRDQADQLKTRLADLKKKWTDAGKSTRTEKIRDVPFDVLSLDLGALPRQDGPATLPKIDLFVGQYDSLLLLATASPTLEKVLARQAGGSVPCLAEVAAFEADHRTLFRDVDSYGWIHVAPLADILAKTLAAAGAGADSNPLVPKPDRIAAALGVLDIKTLAFSGRETPEGSLGDLFLGIPAEKRKGLLKMFAGEPKPSQPPAFVPADVTEFSRFRLDGQKLWTHLEGLVNELAPGMLGMLMGTLESALKEKDPNFDFRKNLVGNLGDDFISFAKAPRSDKPDDIANAPQITLIGSPNADALISALRSLLLIAPAPVSEIEIKERNFLGRKIHSVQIPSEDGENTLSFCASGGYLAVTTDTALLEDYLRSGDAKAKPLTQMTGLMEAAAKIGGTETGLFSYQNDAENMRVALNFFKNHGSLLEEGVAEMLSQNPEAEALLNKAKEWIDLSLLPPWERIAKFFSFTVMAGKTSNDGFRLGVFTPMPAGLK